MIPEIRAQGILPPFTGENATVRDEVSPYWATMDEIVDRYATGEKRNEILDGLLRYRRDLMEVGFTGFQWLAGSFVEDIEHLQNRHPNDVDVVTFLHRPPQLRGEGTWQSFLQTHIAGQLFKARNTKRTYVCDCYIVDLDEPPGIVVDNTRYWNSLFTHQRETYLWKGIIAVGLDPLADSIARTVFDIKTAF